jgi:molybdenum cofactor guanylyltransferase
VRPDQRTESTRAPFPQIVDRQPGAGPITGIAAALLEHPKAAWLVLAGDLPLLTHATLDHLIERRDPARLATAYRSVHDGLPEPLCAIWEPHVREALLAYMAGGKQCPRKFLIGANPLLLEAPQARALDNVNTAEEFSAASEALNKEPGSWALDSGQNEFGGQQASAAHATASASSAATVQSPEPRAPAAAGRCTIRVQYFAILREQAGRSEETLDTLAATPAELYEELRARHPFQLSPAQLKVAVNSDFSDWRAPLRHGDVVVFIPPVAGG